MRLGHLLLLGAALLAVSVAGMALGPNVDFDDAADVYGQFIDFNDQLDDLSHQLGFGPQSWSHGIGRAYNPNVDLFAVLGETSALLARYTTANFSQFDYMTRWDPVARTVVYDEIINGTGRDFVAYGLALYVTGSRIYGQDQQCAEIRVTKPARGVLRVAAKCDLIATLAYPDCDPDCADIAEVIVPGRNVTGKGIVTRYPCFLAYPAEGLRAMSRTQKYHEYVKVERQWRLNRVVNGFRQRVLETVPSYTISAYPLGLMSANHPWLSDSPNAPVSQATGSNGIS